MKTIKYFMVIILALCLCQIAVTEERVKPKPMKEFTDPSSPSYVPYPYPKNRKEIIDDLKYAINKLFVDRDGVYLDGKIPEIKKLLVQLVENNPIYKIGEIIKVKNRTHLMADDYTWLILIMSPNGEIAARLSMKANGLFSGGGLTKFGAEYYRNKYPNSRRGPQYLTTEDDVIKRLSEDIGETFEKLKIKKMERVGFLSSRLAGLCRPMFEIEMTSGKIYYYSVKTEEVYEVEERVNWKKNKRGSMVSPWELVPKEKKYVTDSIKEEILVLKPLIERDTVYIYK